jgi:hypothetical protein
VTSLTATSLESWQAWLAVEHEAVWLYSLIGGRVEDLSDAARRAWNSHRDARDRLITIVQEADGKPDGPHLSYQAAPIESAADARRAAQTVESKVAVAAMSCIADAQHRPDVVAAIRAAARMAADWGAPPKAFPGLE